MVNEGTPDPRASPPNTALLCDMSTAVNTYLTKYDSFLKMWLTLFKECYPCALRLVVQVGVVAVLQAVI